MYDSNNVHILVYVVFGLIGLIVGRFWAWANVRLCEEKKIFSKRNQRIFLYFITKWFRINA